MTGPLGLYFLHIGNGLADSLVPSAKNIEGHSGLINAMGPCLSSAAGYPSA